MSPRGRGRVREMGLGERRSQKTVDGERNGMHVGAVESHQFAVLRHTHSHTHTSGVPFAHAGPEVNMIPPTIITSLCLPSRHHSVSLTNTLRDTYTPNIVIL